MRKLRDREEAKEDEPSHDRWLVSYADFVTLLFAFFVVMYAISTLNEGKYRVLSEAMNAAFRHQAVVAPLPTTFVPMTRLAPRNPLKLVDPVRVQQEDKLRGLAADLSQALHPLLQSGEVRLM